MAAPKAPKGAKSDKEWREAVRVAVHELRLGGGEKAEKVKVLRLLARALVDKALGGDVTALKEVGDRLDGKAVQGVELGGPDGGPVQHEDVSPVEAARSIGFTFAAAAEALKKASESTDA